MFNELVEFEVDVVVTHEEIDLIIDRFYDYYRKKKITNCFAEYMMEHFRCMSDDAYEFKSKVDLNFVLGELYLYELCDSRVEVNPRDTKKIIKKIKHELEG